MAKKPAARQRPTAISGEVTTVPTLEIHLRIYDQALTEHIRAESAKHYRTLPRQIVYMLQQAKEQENHG